MGKFYQSFFRLNLISYRICDMNLKCKWFNLIIVNFYAFIEDKSKNVKNDF